MMTSTAIIAIVPCRFQFPRPNRTTSLPPPAPPCRRCCPLMRPRVSAGEVRRQQRRGPACSSPTSAFRNRSSTALAAAESSSSGRRGLVLWATLPIWFLLSHQHGAASSNDNKAQGVDADGSSVVRTEVRKVLSKAKAAGVLRLAFHDAGTFDIRDKIGGMNGSIVLELDRPENAGLTKSVKILEKAKSELDKVQQVSWADLIAVAGAEAVSLCGGPSIPINLGRMDARIPDPDGKLPEESLVASDLKKCFLGKGFSTQELVVLSGAHTLGGKGFGNPNAFDNTYYKVLLEKPWISSDSMSKMIGLKSDHALVEDEECLRWITSYAADQVKFFDDFGRAYIKLVNTGASWRKVQ